MIQRVYSDTKVIELNSTVKHIEFYKHETGNIDIYKVFGEGYRLIAFQGFFRGDYKVDYIITDTEQLSIFDI